ncbi:MAG: alanine racemase [Brumimicrobium sp.]|nr:alanine racemase [Brumimicrobium sp.]
MKLGLAHQEICNVVDGQLLQHNKGSVDVVVYDTRIITTDRHGVFFALQGKKDGHDFVEDAYKKGVRCFVLSRSHNLPPDATVILVKDTLKALQSLAKYHRNQFSYPVLAITGSLGKTMIKEWLYFLIKDDYDVIRSPKSFNSQIGVALSLLEMDETHNFAIIEADISKPDEMDSLEEMISPTMGIFTGVGKYYSENFNSEKEHFAEHLKLFKHTNVTFALKDEHSALRRNKINAALTAVEEWEKFSIHDKPFPGNRALALFVARYLGVDERVLKTKVDQLPILPNRMEVFEGQNHNLIINDTYNIDIDALEQSLEYQFASTERKIRVVVLDLSFVSKPRIKQIKELVNRYNPDHFFIIENDRIPEELKQIRNASILFKGSYRSNLHQHVALFKNRKHETWVEFDLKAIKFNIDYLQSLTPKNTKTLVMVKASSYGTGDVNIPHFLQQTGIDYLGVAYTDEGTTLRENGISLPIMVMNTEKNAFEDLTKFCLEPSIYSLDQLREFCDHLKKENLVNYPIHLTFETGMNRLGFDSDEIPDLINFILNQPEIRIQSVYSHLADADNPNTEYTENQIAVFNTIRQQILRLLSPDNAKNIIFHLLNSEGVLKFGQKAAFDMVRLGIGVFGYASISKNLKPCLKWKTTVSQIKHLKPGETVSYGRTFRAEKEMRTATLRIGYADGFRRSLSNGRGKVYINGKYCPVIGTVCMDMTMVDISEVTCQEGDEVEIIGDHISMEEFAKDLNTIPYEIMTSINKRVSRIYLKP